MLGIENEESRRLKCSMKMKMLQMIGGKTMKDKINNERIHEMMGVDSVECGEIG